MPMTTCPFCGKKIPNIFSKHHREVCRVRRGLDKREPNDPEPVSKGQKRITDMIVGSKR